MTTLTAIGIENGIWRGVMQASTSDEPEVRVTYLGKDVAEWSVKAVAGAPDQWTLEVPVPAEAISDGVHTIVVSKAGDGSTVLGQFSLIAGNALAGDVQAEVSILRAELDLLKRAFRKHCSE